MPCSVSEAEKAYYEAEQNLERFGVRISHAELVTRVACELARALDAHADASNVDGRAGLSGMSRRWIKYHEEQDRKRNEPLRSIRAAKAEPDAAEEFIRSVTAVADEFAHAPKSGIRSRLLAAVEAFKGES